VLVSHDSDFGTLLAVQRQSKPSLILIRSADPLTTTEIAAMIAENLEVMFDDLGSGAIISFARGHFR
jgi:predicted nuclease of predicted toxin-antitoxin system